MPPKVPPRSNRPGFLQRQSASLAQDTTPTVALISPNASRAGGGVVVVITGTNFYGPVAVSFNGVFAIDPVVNADRTTITVTAPASEEGGVFDVVVYNGWNQFVTVASGFIYYRSVIDTITPSHGVASGGYLVRLVGNNFDSGGSTVTFDGVAASSVEFVDPQQMLVTVPAHTGYGPINVVITDSSGDAVTVVGGFTYTSGVLEQDVRRNPNTSTQDALNNAPRTANFAVSGFGAPPVVGEAVSLVNDGTQIYDGIIQRKTTSYEDSCDNLIHTLVAIDRTYLFNRHRPFGVYDNQPADVVIRDLVTRYASEFTTVFVQTNLQNISIVLDGTMDMATAMSTILSKIGEGHWYIDKWDLHAYHLTMSRGSLFGSPAATGNAPMVAGVAPMVVTVSAVANNGLLPPGWYVFRATPFYGTPPTYGTPLVATPPGYVLLSNEAATLNLTGSVSNGSYAVAGVVAPPSAGTIPGGGSVRPEYSLGQQLSFVFTASLNNGETTVSPAVTFTVTVPGVGSTVQLPRLIAPAIPSGGSSLACYASIDGGATYHRIAAGLAAGQAFNFLTPPSILNTFPAPPSSNTANFPLPGRGWIGYNGTTYMPELPTTAPGGNVVYYASPDVARVLEAQANQSFEGSLNQTSIPIFLQNFLPSFSSIPIGPAVGARTASSRRIYYQRYGDAHGAGGTPTLGYYTLNDNTTAALTAPVPSYFASALSLPNTQAPFGPSTALVVAQSASAITSSDFIGYPLQVGSYAAKMSGVYQDGTESYPTPISNVVVMDGTKQLRVTTYPIFPAVGGVTCVYRKLYTSVFAPAPTVGVPTFLPPTVLLTGIIPDNTTTGPADFEIGGGMTGGDGKQPDGTPVGTPSIIGHIDGVNPELSLPQPDDLVDGPGTLLCLDPPIQIEEDGSQLRNRVFVKGLGTILVSDAAVGATQIAVMDVSMFSDAGGKFCIGERVIDYTTRVTTVGACKLNLAAPLARGILQADWKFGGGTPVRPFITVEDKQSQKLRGAVELKKDGSPSDGIHEYTIDDSTLVTTEQCINSGLADLQLFAYPIRKITYWTRDAKTRKGATVHANMTKPPIVGDFIIQTISIDQYKDESDDLPQRYQVTADSAAKYDLNDLLLDLSDAKDSIVSNAGMIATAIASVPAGVILSTFNYTAAQWRALGNPSTPVEIAPSVAGYAAIMIWSTVIWTYSTPFPNSPQLRWRWTNDSIANLINSATPNETFNNGFTTVTGLQSVTIVTNAATRYSGKGIWFDIASDPGAGAVGNVTLTIMYHYQPIPA